MNIKDKNELIALHRCLLEAKFNPNPNDLDIAGSPIAARIANKVVEELSVIDSEAWDEWRKAENHLDRIDNLKTSLKFQNLSSIVKHTERKEFVINALAPLIADEELVEVLVEEVFETK